ncbi:MAG: hypothetical protein MUE32_08485 [Bacteroidales bacterium]|nr:hypothetical protein [Bacteroidales bacterium]
MKTKGFHKADPWLEPYKEIIINRYEKACSRERKLAGSGTLAGFACGHHYYGLHRSMEGWVFREWAPNASSVFLTGDFSGWKEGPGFSLTKVNSNGDWEIRLDADALSHGDLYKLSVNWEGGKG